MTYAIWWLRRDLRLSDNPVLQDILARGETPIALFILDPQLLVSDYVAPARLAFMLAGLWALDADLRARGSRLIVRQGQPLAELMRLYAESGAQRIVAEADVSSYAQQRDAAISRQLPVEWVGSPAVRPPGSVLTAGGRPYTVFTPFSKTWKALPGLPVGGKAAPDEALPDRLLLPPDLSSLPIPEADSPPGFPAGEVEAQRRLAAFALDGLADYALRRDRPDLHGTSQLSPYLRFGMLSPRQAVRVAINGGALAAEKAAKPSVQAARNGAAVWLSELIWREFYLHLLYHFSHLRQNSFRSPEPRWRNQPGEFAAWCEARTGYPLVDAAMRQLLQTGWMHNRARMVVASFLTKDLLVDWRWGERFFMQHLLDGDPAANNGGWQWTAGTGADAAPYFRIFNPVLQSQRYDPQGDFIRTWLPQLADVPAAYIHAPWLMDARAQMQAGCQIGHDYPAPLVEHAAVRERTLRAYKPASESESSA